MRVLLGYSRSSGLVTLLRNRVERWSNQLDSGQNALSPGAARWAERSLIGMGLYEAMADQWIKPLAER